MLTVVVSRWHIKTFSNKRLQVSNDTLLLNWQIYLTFRKVAFRTENKKCWKVDLPSLNHHVNVWHTNTFKTKALSSERFSGSFKNISLIQNTNCIERSTKLCRCFIPSNHCFKCNEKTLIFPTNSQQHFISTSMNVCECSFHIQCG